jgi:hypothetical protein
MQGNSLTCTPVPYKQIFGLLLIFDELWSVAWWIGGSAFPSEDVKLAVNGPVRILAVDTSRLYGNFNSS